MKRVRINKGFAGAVYKHGDYNRTLEAGTHWLGFGESIYYYDKTNVYSLTSGMLSRLQDKNFLDKIDLIEIRDNELVLLFEHGNFKQTLTPGRYFIWKNWSSFDTIKIDLGKVEITESIDKSLLQSGVLHPYLRIYEVKSYEEGLLFVDEQFVKKLQTGTYFFWKNASKIEVLKADMRQLQLEVSGQEILTKDKAVLRINFYVHYKITDIKRALMDNKGYEKQLYILTQLALREFIGTKTLDELLENKESVTAYVKEYLSIKSASLGIEISDSGMKDIILPGDVRDIMNQVLIAQKQAQANTIKRREETASTRNLLNTAKLMEDNAMLFKLKEMEYVEKIADKINTISLSGGNQVLDQLRDIFTQK